MRRFTFAGAPADSCGKPGGTEHGPDALRDVGMMAALNSAHARDLDTLMRGTRRDSMSGLTALEGVIEATLVLRRRLAQLIEDDQLPFVAGGCSAIAPGALAGARDGLAKGQSLGLIYVSGHMDLYDGDTAPDGHGADMALATILGRGPRAWGALLGEHAPVKPEDVVMVGFRDREEAEQVGALMPEDFQPHLTCYDIDHIRQHGAAATSRAALGRVTGPSTKFWLHIDVDVLDELAFPAANYLMPGGLEWEDLSVLLRPMVMSPALAGLSLAGYNPEKDEGSSCGLHLVDMFRAFHD
ncbi:MAG: arginase family protein [Alphaproteobacteria bacterium]|nr:arginase family protein [Alphaproteobacteria bacterium]